MVYVLTFYSFSSEKEIHGPFDTWEKAWEYAKKDCSKEMSNDIAMDRESKMRKDKDTGEIVLTTNYSDGPGTTTWFVLEIPN